VISSPLIRCVQTAASACAALGVDRLAIEPGLIEEVCQPWYGSWAVAGADSTWGGPKTEAPEGSQPRPERLRPAHELLMDAKATAAALADLGAVCVDANYRPAVPAAQLTFTTEAPESPEQMHARLGAVARGVHGRYDDESVLLVSHCAPSMAMHNVLTGEAAPGIGLTGLSVYASAHAPASALLEFDTSHCAIMHLLRPP
jgi:broad specificity phosphatase PhoE